MLKSRAQAAKAQRKIQDAVGDLGTNSSMDAFKRMEEKVEELEALGEASFELAGQDLESKFAELEGGNDIEKELEVLRSQLKMGLLRRLNQKVF